MTMMIRRLTGHNERIRFFVEQFFLIMDKGHAQFCGKLCCRSLCTRARVLICNTEVADPDEFNIPHACAGPRIECGVITLRQSDQSDAYLFHVCYSTYHQSCCLTAFPPT